MERTAREAFEQAVERLGQGRENVRQFLLANRDIRNEIDAKLRATLGLPAAEAGVERGDKTEKTEKGKPEAPEAAKKKA